jgi:phosphate transport system permease protein
MATPPASASAALATESDRLVDTSPRTRFRLGFDRAMSWLTPLLFLVAIIPILDMVYYIAAKVVPSLTWNVVTSTSLTQTDVLGVPLISTGYLVGLATALAVLFGLGGGIATAEFLPERWANVARTGANILVGTPSVIIGYLGYFGLVLYLHWGPVFIAGTLTLSFFMTPYVFRTADLAFSSIPRPIREAALGSGAGSGQYIGRVGIQIAFPQILTGVFLAMAIGIGETAPLVLTTEPGVLVPANLFAPVTVLTEVIWENFSSPLPVLKLLALQAAFLLLVIVIGLNVVVRLISRRYQKRLEGLYQ